MLFFAGVFFAVEELDDFFAADDDELDFFAGDFLAVEELDDFFAAVFFVAEDDELDFFAGDFFAVDVEVAFLAVDFFAVDELLLFFAVEPDDVLTDPPEARSTAAAVRLMAGWATDGAAFSTAAKVRAGSFLAPETTSLSWAPGLKAGTVFFSAFIRSPVDGLRTQRASRTRRSKEPNPVIATFSPRATSRVMVSRTASSAWAAAFRLPS